MEIACCSGGVALVVFLADVAVDGGAASLLILTFELTLAFTSLLRVDPVMSNLSWLVCCSFF